MAAQNTTYVKRFVSRAPDKSLQVSLVPHNEPTPRPKSNVSKSKRMRARESSEVSSSPKVSSIPIDTSTNMEELGSDKVPARRVIVIRNTKNPQKNREPVDIGDFGQSNSARIAPVFSNERSSVYFIRRQVTQSNSTKPT